MATFAWKISLALLIVSMVPMVVQADQDDDNFWCTPCANVIDDFSEELKNTTVQETFERICIDIVGNDSEDIEYCHDENSNYFGFIRWLLNLGFEGDDVCVFLGACVQSSPEQKQKFAKLRQNPFFKSQSKQFFGNYLKSAKIAKVAKALKH